MKNVYIFIALLVFPFLAVAQDSVVTSPLKIITAVPTVDTAAYAAGDVINATVITLTGACKTGKAAIVQDISIGDLAANTGLVEAVFFNSAITSYGTVNNPFDPADADLAAYFQASVLLDNSASYNDSSVVYAKNAGRVVACNAAGNLFLVLVARAAITYGAATDAKVKVTLLQ